MSGTWRHPVALGFAALLLLIVAAATFAIVPETKQAVILRLEKPVRTVNQWHAGEVFGRSGAGLIARVPFIDKLVWVDKRVLAVDLDDTPVLSTDQLRLEVDAFARFRIVDPLRAVISTGSTANTEEQVGNQLRLLLGTALRNELGKVQFAVLLSPERGRIMEAIQTSLDRQARRYGAEITDVRIKKTELPGGSPLESALSRMRTARRQEANTIEAKGLRDATIVRAEADAQAARIYAASFSQDPDFYDFYRSMQSYRHTFGVDGSKPEGSTNLILSPNNAYLRNFENGGR